MSYYRVPDIANAAPRVQVHPLPLLAWFNRSAMFGF